MEQDTAAFIAEAKAKLDRLTGKVVQRIKVGDRVRYADTERARKLGWPRIGCDGGYVSNVEAKPDPEYTKIYHKDADAFNWECDLEVIPWIEWHGGDRPAAADEYLEIRFEDEPQCGYECDPGTTKDESWTYADTCWRRIIEYRVLKKVPK